MSNWMKSNAYVTHWFYLARSFSTLFRMCAYVLFACVLMWCMVKCCRRKYKYMHIPPPAVLYTLSLVFHQKQFDLERAKTFHYKTRLYCKIDTHTHRHIRTQNTRRTAKSTIQKRNPSAILYFIVPLLFQKKNFEQSHSIGSKTVASKVVK